ncbi:MAG TPA: TIGR03564 family F420-dependent LLM class oxidoreductase [Frankiaceae bacterium]|jgi:F420-dependent oxidoreductase-like protein|nr:TIGR03564 family F420-dependent LLM class oxidoreductase [Frankiaceae bacterium]
MTTRFRISAWAGSGQTSVADVTAGVQKAADAGFDGVWLPQTLSVDAIAALAVAATKVPAIHVGTAVVPLQGRHPFPLAQQALTAADAAGPGRFTLGVGVTHAFVSETFYGFPYRDAVALCREELQALQGLLGPDRKVSIAGKFVTTQVGVTMQTPTPSVVVAALGPKMLALAGELSDGTVTWMTGAKTLQSRIVPGISEAAAHADRGTPRVIAGLPVCVTSDVMGARDAVRPRIQAAGQMPSYQRQLGLEGMDDVAQLAIVGDGDHVLECIAALAEAGVTELMADVFGSPEEQDRTREVLCTFPRDASLR